MTGLSLNRALLLLPLSAFLLVVAFHDYPDHEHFSFAHEMISKEAPAEKAESEKFGLKHFPMDFCITEAEPPVLSPVGQLFVSSVFFMLEYGDRASGLAPPAVRSYCASRPFFSLTLSFLFPSDFSQGIFLFLFLTPALLYNGVVREFLYVKSFHISKEKRIWKYV